MNMQIDFVPFLSWPWLAGFVALVLAALALMLVRGIKGATLRFCMAALLFASLANPIIRHDVREPLADIVVAVVDQSASQTIGKRTAQTEKALVDLKARIAILGSAELRIVNVKSGTDPATDGTRLFTALARAMADIPKDRFGGAFLITDGQVHDVPTNLVNLSSPIHSLITGSKNENDRRLVIDRAPKFGIVGKDQVIQFHVEESDASVAAVEATVLVQGEAPHVNTVVPGHVTDQHINIAHAGQNFVSLSAAVKPGELSEQNNKVVVMVEGIRDRLRVLLVSGQPHPGERTWRDLLKADADVDLVHFTILRPPEKQDGTPANELSLIAFPTRELFIDKLRQFDLVIFDRYRREAILPDSYMANVADYVKNGGAVLVASGPDFADSEGLYSSPLSEILGAAPTGQITEQPFKPMLSETGKRHPVTRDLPNAGTNMPSWGRWFRLIDTNVNSGSETLMVGPENKPLLVLGHQGQGRVAQLLSDHGWLWARGFEGGGPQTELLRRMAHWLMKQPELEEESLSAKQQGNDLIVTRQSLSDAAKPITITDPQGNSQTINLAPQTPGIFTATVPSPKAGLYSLTDGTLQAAAMVGTPDTKETSDIRATTQKLAPVAAATKGGIAWLEEGMPNISKSAKGQLLAGAGWMNIAANGQFRVIAVDTISLFSTLFSLAVLLLAASLMWLREGR